ncbi:MAG: alpha/beta fold hydrolase [Chloroflexota bacterium]
MSPDWLDRTTYPFESHYMDVADGCIHYVDEGDGDAIVMIHGTPTWSYLYRHLIMGLRDNYRIIALDHLGFGLSDKPDNYSYKPEDQAKNIALFIDQLELDIFTLVVHDFGGPIGLSYAIEHPEKIQRLVLFNTWLWSLKNDVRLALAGRLFSSVLGKLLFLRFNFELNVIFPSAFGERSKLTDAIYDHYRQPVANPISQQAIWVYAKELLNSHAWYDSLWAQRDKLASIPMLLAWGMKDPVLGKSYFKRWREAFPDAQTIIFKKTGHYVQEEQGASLVPVISDFLSKT